MVFLECVYIVLLLLYGMKRRGFCDEIIYSFVNQPTTITQHRWV